jgi:formylglycine-generating enzyme
MSSAGRALSVPGLAVVLAGGCGVGQTASRISVVGLPPVATASTAPTASASPGGCLAGMASLPAGTFSMGDRGDHVTDATGEDTKPCAFPARDGSPLQCTLGDTVTVHPFCLDVTEVTVDAYAACVRAGRCSADHTSEMGNDAGSLTRDAACNYGANGRGNHPINCVDWEQAGAYCRAQDKRLPTEEEWEWAARGGPEGRTFPCGATLPDSQLCWSGPGGATKRKGTCPAGSFPSGDAPGGIHDLSGDVWEWTSSQYDAKDTSRDSGGRVRALDRVYRGGSWRDAEQCTAAVRYPGPPSMWRRVDVGFRCAR